MAINKRANEQALAPRAAQLVVSHAPRTQSLVSHEKPSRTLVGLSPGRLCAPCAFDRCSARWDGARPDGGVAARTDGARPEGVGAKSPTFEEEVALSAGLSAPTRDGLSAGF